MLPLTTYFLVLAWLGLLFWLSLHPSAGVATATSVGDRISELVWDDRVTGHQTQELIFIFMVFSYSLLLGYRQRLMQYVLISKASVKKMIGDAFWLLTCICSPSTESDAHCCRADSGVWIG